MFNILSAVQHPTGFTTLAECIENGAYAVFPFPEENEYALPQFVLALQNGTVVGSGAIVTQDGTLLRDTETYKEDQHRLLIPGCDDIACRNQFFFEGSLAVISSPGQQCYYHWLLEVLPRLKALVASGMPYDKIYLDARDVNRRWQFESLYAVMDYLHISRDRLLLIDDGSVVTAKTLLVPSIIWTPSKGCLWAADLTWFKAFFNDVFVKKNCVDLPKHIFISRSKAQYRRISNEAALIDFLSSKGFVTVYLEDLSVYDQAALFSNADVIVGPHGAGFTNLIFCKPGTRIIEIDHGIKGEEQRSFYKYMTKYMQCTYHPFYVGLLEETDAPEIILAPVNQDITVSIAEFGNFYHEVFGIN